MQYLNDLQEIYNKLPEYRDYLAKSAGMQVANVLVDRLRNSLEKLAIEYNDYLTEIDPGKKQSRLEVWNEKAMQVFAIVERLVKGIEEINARNN